MSAETQQQDQWSVKRVLEWTTGRFERDGIPSPRVDAEVLLGHCLAVERIRLYMELQKPLSSEELARYRELVRRRIAGEPVAYITGSREFWSLELAVSAAVLVPRPETELLVEVTLGLLRAPPPSRGELTYELELELPRELEVEVAGDGQQSDAAAERMREPEERQPGGGEPAGEPGAAVEWGGAGEQQELPRSAEERGSAEAREDGPAPIIVDVGTGSGAVALALARELPVAVVYATDLSGEALSVARLNAERHGLALSLCLGDLLEALPRDLRPHLIAANLPYIPTQVLPSLQREVSVFEPRQALDGGPDGLVIVRRLVAQAAARLRPGGWLVLEIGHDQGRAVAELMASSGYADVTIHQDLAGLDRVVSGKLPP